ncbi:hypothetical protein K469DRAFT_731169 [Zopfia rhizophila CBS 207.26]|uniref:NAD(P)-binding protein n=1 Tax=Zopfia rhizophila CBS 207.26 TaxID=1314779 RepID=A0A6A6ERJ5_9PEZI|nr:hypothetical protein K469DRAFT_731169 [Zopfia rhizophila CBS 207.26]
MSTMEAETSMISILQSALKAVFCASQRQGKILCLITGSSGHLGFWVIVDALEAVLAALSIRELNPGSRLQFVVIPDILIDGAYDEAIQGATYAIHITSPLASVYKEGDDMGEVFIESAMDCITSSVAAITPFKDLASRTSETVWDENSRIPLDPPPYTNAFESYSAGKLKAFNDTEAWVEKQKPAFDVVHIFPSYIICDSTHASGCALAHVKALDSRGPGNQGYILSSAGLEFAAAMENGRLANNGKVFTLPERVDERKSETALGMKYIGFSKSRKAAGFH